jgi:hypothetical protein
LTIEAEQHEEGTAEVGIDIGDLFAEALAQENGEAPADEDDGPSDEEGELSSGEVEQEEPGDSDSDPEEELAEEDDDVEHAAGELESEDDSEADETVEEESDPNPAESERVKALEAKVEELTGYLLALVGNKAKEPDREPRREESPPGPSQAELAQIHQATRMMLWGSLPGETEEDLKAIPPHIRRQAQDNARALVQNETVYALHPDLRYRDQIADHVQQHVERIVAPLRNELQEHRAKALVNRYPVLSDSAAKRRVGEIFNTLDGLAPEKRLEIAVRQYEGEVGKSKLAKDKQKVSISKRQQAGVRRAKRGAKGPQGKKRGGQRRTEMKVVGGEPDVAAFFEKELQKQLAEGS